MLDETISAFPAEYQFTAWVTVFIALLIAAVWWFNRKFNAPVAAAASPIDMRALGVAISNDRAQRDTAEALQGIDKTLKEIRAIYDRNTERDIDRFARAMERVSELSDRIADLSGEKPGRRGKG